MKKVIFLLAGVLLTFQLFAQTTGTLSVSVTTASTGGTYSPKNIFVIWIEDASGNFVKTLNAYADKRIQYLYTWASNTAAKSSQYSRVDAVTGATLSGHGTRTGSWNGTNYNKNIVADGTYYVCFELTDKHAQGNYSRFAFVKGADNNVTPANVTGFSNISIQWKASGITAAEAIESPDDIEIFPNPTKNIFFIRGNGISEIEVLNLAGTLVQKNNSTTRVDLSNFKSGIYLVKIKKESHTIIKKIIKE